MRTPTWSTSRLAVVQAAVLLLFVAVLISPLNTPTLFGLDPAGSWTIICLGTSALIWIPDLLAGRFPATDIDWVLWFYLATVAVTAIWSVDGTRTLAAALTLAGHVGLFYATVVVSRKLPGFAGWVLVLLAIGIALVELIAFAHHLEVGLSIRPKEYLAPQGWSGYPELGALGLIQFAIVMAGVISARHLKNLLAGAGLLLVIGIELLFLYSRTTWVGAIVIIFASLVVNLLNGRNLKRGLAAAAVMIVLAFGMIAISPTVRSLVRNLAGEPALATAPGLELAAPTSRLKLWSETLRMIGDSPWHGAGLGNFRPVFESRYNPELNGDLRRGVQAHNLWLQVTAELGVIGGAAHLALWGSLWWVSWRTVRRRPGFVATAVVLAIAGMTASNATDNVPSLIAGARLYPLAWVIFGLAAAFSRKEPCSLDTTEPMIER